MCPFHNDHNPSLTVKGGHWKCWACGAHGDVIDFVEKLDGVDFVGAVSKLGVDFGIETGARPMSKAERVEAFEDRILREIEQHNTEECRKALNGEINELTMLHRVLLQHGAPDALINQYAEKIDELMAECKEEPLSDKRTGFEYELSEEIRRRGNHDEKLRAELNYLITIPLSFKEDFMDEEKLKALADEIIVATNCAYETAKKTGEDSGYLPPPMWIEAIEWVKRNILPDADFPCYCSSSNLNDMLRKESRIRMTDSQFKLLMIECGFLPVDPYQTNWIYAIRNTSPAVERWTDAE